MKMRRLKRSLSVFLALILALGTVFSNLPALAADTPVTVAEWTDSSTITQRVSTQAPATGGVNKADAVLTTQQNATMQNSSSTGNVFYVEGWNSSAAEKYWQINLSTEGYTNLTLSLSARYGSVTANGTTYSGPHDWKVQYSTNGTDFTDVENSAFSVTKAISTQAFGPFTLPSAANNCKTLVIRVVATQVVDIPSSANPSAGLGQIKITGTPATASVDKTALNSELDTANGKVSSAVAGSQPGNYPQDAINALKAAITTAQAVADNATAAQADVDKAVTDLKAAEATFDAAVIKVEAVSVVEWHRTSGTGFKSPDPATAGANMAGATLGTGSLDSTSEQVTFNNVAKAYYYTAKVEAWNNGNSHYWQISFSAKGYQGLSLSADTASPIAVNAYTGNSQAPTDWKVQVSTDGTNFTDVKTYTNGETLSNYMGAVALPSVLNDSGTVTVRFLAVNQATGVNASVSQLNNIVITGTPATASADKTALNSELDTANGKVSSAVAGSQPGNYPQDAINALKAAITTAQAVADNATAAQADVDKAVTDLKAAEATFDAAVIKAADKTQLNNDVTAAQALHDGATPGTQPGNYPQDAITAFQTAIDAAKAVANNANATQADVDTADGTLTAAVATFKGKQVPTGPTIAQVRAQGTGSVSFTGYVTRVVNGSTMYVQDSTAGIQIYGSGFDSATYPEGTQVTVSGTLAKYPPTSAQPTLEVQSPVITKTGAPISKVPPVALDFATYSANYQKYEGTLISIHNVKLTSGKGATYGITDGSTSVDLYTKNGASVTPAMNTQVDVTGIATIYNNAPEIFFTTSTDIVPHGTVTVDKTALNSAITSAQALYDGAVVGDKAGNYPQSAKDTFGAAIDAAKAVAAKADATQADVDKAAGDLSKAVTAFKAAVITATVDKAALTSAISAAQALYDGAVVGDKAGNYPQSAKDTFGAAIDAAKAVVAKADATQADVDTATGDLNAAVTTFKATVITAQVDKTQLNSDLTAANGKVKDAVAGNQPGNYPPSAIDAYKTAIAAAQAVADKSDATQAEVDKAVSDLTAAESAFDKAKIPSTAVDKTALNNAIAAAQGKYDAAVVGTQPGSYPQSAKDALGAAIDAAKAVAGNADATQTQADAAVTTLNSAVTTFDRAVIKTVPTTTVTDSATGVQVTGALPDDAQLVVNQITGGADYQKAKTALADVSGQYVLYDLSLLTQNGGVKWEPSNGNTVQISLPIPDGFDTSRLAVYYIADNGSKERISGKVVGDRYVFNASHLSQYALVETASSPSSQNPSSQTPSSQTPSSSTSSASNPKTGTDTLPAGAIVLFVGAAACAALMLGKRRRDR